MKTMFKWAGCIVLGFLALLLVLGATSTPEEHKQSSAWLDARQDVKAMLRDPGSAVFGPEQTYQGGDIVCGTVNAKNGFGGYTGYRLYIWDRMYGGNGALIEPAMGSSHITFREAVERKCTDTPPKVAARTPAPMPIGEPLIPSAPWQPRPGTGKPWDKASKK